MTSTFLGKHQRTESVSDDVGNDVISDQDEHEPQEGGGTALTLFSGHTPTNMVRGEKSAKKRKKKKKMSKETKELICREEVNIRLGST